MAEAPIFFAEVVSIERVLDTLGADDGLTTATVLRDAALALADAMERRLNIHPRTAELREQWRKRQRPEAHRPVQDWA